MAAVAHGLLAMDEADCVRCVGGFYQVVIPQGNDWNQRKNHRKTIGNPKYDWLVVWNMNGS